MLLDVRNISKTFPGGDAPISVLSDVSFSLDRGETLALTGESGSGKSTLLHIIAGLESADDGQVFLNGTDVTGLGDAGRARIRRSVLGIVFQQFNLIPSLPVAANIRFQALLCGRDPGPETTEKLVSALGLGDQLHKYPEELSGGQQQRVAIARAILHSPEIVLADEPTGNLDEATADAVFDALLAQVRQAGTGLLLVTHSQRLAARADRRLHLSRGLVAP